MLVADSGACGCQPCHNETETTVLNRCSGTWAAHRHPDLSRALKLGAGARPSELGKPHGCLESRVALKVCSPVSCTLWSALQFFASAVPQVTQLSLELPLHACGIMWVCWRLGVRSYVRLNSETRTLCRTCACTRVQ
jgi:hypothetical protein